jgi:hypothetical protein
MRGPKRVYIKFPGIGLCRYRIVLETALTVVIEHIKCVEEYSTWNISMYKCSKIILANGKSSECMPIAIQTLKTLKFQCG